MALADDPLEITLAGEVIHLRPSLRVAMRLERRYDGFPNLVKQIQEETLTTYVDVLQEFTDLPFLENRIWDAGLPTLRPVLLLFILQLAGADEPQAEGEAITHREYLTKLFEIATGWIGWTPDTAWEATPAEIEAAMKGRLDMLKSIFGGSEEEKPKADIPLEQKWKMAFQTLGTTKVKRPH